MIISVADLKVLPEFSGKADDEIKAMADAVELMIRRYTHNNFQNRNIRFLAGSDGTTLDGSSPYLKVGDTIQVSESLVNDGLYVITGITDGQITVDSAMYAVDHNLVTKVEYPADIRLGVLNMLKWEATAREKVGIKSETISRHSVTYYDQDANNQVMGYPVSILGFLTPYIKARF